jgi:transcriptional regulator with XRE-family HTH domain
MHENRVYISQPTSIESRLMPKYTLDQEEGFAARLTRLRKAAGFTQAQLADELGISRRRIAYYESESDHPPASLLQDLARALNTTLDELLGSQPAKRKPRAASLSPRLERRLKQIERLSPKPKQQLLSIIDTFIAAEQHRQGSRS